MRTRFAAILLLAFAGFAFAASEARALTLQAAFRSSTYQVMPGDTYADLMAAHLAGAPLASLTTTALANVSAQVEAGVGTNYSILLTASLTPSVSGTFAFQVGADWGRGGVAAVLDGNGTVLQELVRSDDIWWANDWNHPDVFTTSVNMTAGSPYTLVWLGFEGCCAGVTTIRFSYEGSPFAPVDETNLTPLTVPEPASMLLVALGAGALTRRQAPHA